MSAGSRSSRVCMPRASCCGRRTVRTSSSTAFWSPRLHPRPAGHWRPWSADLGLVWHARWAYHHHWYLNASECMDWGTMSSGAGGAGTVGPIPLYIAALVATIAMVTDVRSRRIPNWLTGGSVLLGLLLQTRSSGLDGVAI